MVSKKILVLVAFLPLAVGRPVQAQVQQQPPEPQVALSSQRIPDAVAIPEVIADKLTPEQALQRIEALSQALELPIQRQLDVGAIRQSRSGVYLLRSPDYSIKIYPESGGVKYEHSQLYQLTEKRQAETAPPDAALLARARQDLERLAAARLIELDQIDFDTVHISHQRSRSGTRDEKGFQIGKLSTLDSRLDFTRRLGDLRVAGNGVRLIYGNEQKLYGCEIVWRSIRVPPETQPLAVNGAEALANFRSTVEQYTQLGASVELLQAELVHVDPGVRVTISSLEPTYLFLYQVKTPIPEKRNEFDTGKKLVYSVPAVKSTTPPK